MSCVTSICILTDILNNDLEARLETLSFVRVDKYNGGNKACQANIYAAAFNYLDTDERYDSSRQDEEVYEEGNGEENLWKILHALPWHPEAKTKFFINREHETGWSPWEGL